MFRIILAILVMCFFTGGTFAQDGSGKKELSTVKKVVRGFSKIDTNYIEPQHYNFTVMLQSTSTYDIYRLVRWLSCAAPGT